MRVNLRIVQVLADATIPILGYFLWDWGLFFIVLYYLLDLIVSEIFMHLKTREIRKFRSGSMTESMRYIAAGIFLVATTLLLVRLFILQTHPQTDVVKEVIAFWSYKDMGIAQGYLLIPLVIFVGYQRFKTEFLLPKKHETTLIEALWRSHLKSLVLLLTSVGMITGIAYFIVFPDWIYLALLLSSTSAYQLLR
jgi:hypothetical protein